MTSTPESIGKTIFVTGVNGHIGNQIVRDLLKNGYNVKGSVRDLNDASKTEHVIQHAKDIGVEERLELVQGDILDADNWAEMIKGCNSLFHTATIYSNTKDGSLIIDTAL
jgi:nucleoside-diphosphate-sugar epimerase